MELEERFWSKVDWDIHDEDRCWAWEATKIWNGYGRFKVTRTCLGLAHRIAYELEVGEIPEGMVIDHQCGVRHCVNPSHLRAVTPRQNTLMGNGPTAVNARKVNCRCGGPYRQIKLQRICERCDYGRAS
ncbi:HNH endonuclease signature motif containing protein [Streptomyces sp. CC53]|uniref:HNH endonuclease signature motif containing protein n=1 Tax=Streptomyces sp. CC53 TaxID=1906740 RepID=UPI0009A0F7CC|nr:HNH endonuclease signature motif containing protein [Streptomyces sp. CC53]